MTSHPSDDHLSEEALAAFLEAMSALTQEGEVISIDTGIPVNMEQPRDAALDFTFQGNPNQVPGGRYVARAGHEYYVFEMDWRMN